MSTSPSRLAPSDSSCPAAMTTATPANEISAPATFGGERTVHPDRARQQRDEHRRGRDEQRGVARRDLGQAQRPQHLVRPEPEGAHEEQLAPVPVREPDRALPHAEDQQQRDRRDQRTGAR